MEENQAYSVGDPHRISLLTSLFSFRILKGMKQAVTGTSSLPALGFREETVAASLSP